MRYALSMIAGVACGCLLMLLLKLPWLEPFDTNTATVVAALCSTVIAVVGAFFLWWYQVNKRQRDLERLLIPVFDPLYAALCLLRDISDFDSAKSLLTVVKKAGLSVDRPAPTSYEVLRYQEARFPLAAKAAIVEAESVLAHWHNLQDALLSSAPKTLPKVLALHRLARGAVDQIPKLLEGSKPKSLSQVAPNIEPDDAARLSWAIGTLARVLNTLDAGKRDTSGADALDLQRQAAINSWAATGIY